MTKDGEGGEDGFADPIPEDPSRADGRESVVFHYSRSKRLERAPEIVKKAYREGYTPNKGFIKGLTANAGLKSILAVIVILCALIAFLTVTNIPGAISVGNIPMRAKVFSFEDKLYFTLTCEQEPKFGQDPIPVTATVQVVDTGENVLDSRELSGMYSGEEMLLRAVMRDEGTESVRINLSAGGAKRVLLVTVDRK